MACSETVQDGFKLLNLVIGGNLVADVWIGCNVDAFYCKPVFEFDPQIFDELVVLVIEY
ncbi:MAG TPA: hypothetical protein VN954_16210 [Ktedonobacteraceae bacterium]|nr:hypothetical protein [Ktedonobacteraceae bacterium]